MKHYWLIDGVNERFATLSKAKYHLSFYTIEERKRKNGNNICHVVNDEVTTVVEISVNESGKISFTKPSKLNWWDK